MKRTVFASAVAIGLLLGFLFVAPAPGSAAEKVITFSYSSHTPPELGLPWASKRGERRSKNEQMEESNSLITMAGP